MRQTNSQRKLLPLREYQAESVRATIEAFTYTNAVLVQQPTGAGKSLILAAIAQQFFQRDEPILIVAHKVELIRQLADHVEIWLGVEPGIIANKQQFKRNPEALIQVASIQALSSKQINYPSARLIIIDEAHHAHARSYANLFRHYGEQTYYLGLTATPMRLDGRGLRFLYGGTPGFKHLVSGVPTRQLIEEGYLCDYKLFAAKGLLDPKTAGIKSRAGDYIQSELAEYADTALFYGDIVEEWEKHAKGLRTVVYPVSVKYSRELCDEFLSAGYPAEHLDADTPAKEREGILNRFRSGETLILCQHSIIIEGVDCLSEDTEILTPNGWKGVEDKIEECFSLNVKTDQLEITPVKRQFKRSLKNGEEIITLNSQHLDINVTKNHDFWVKRRKNQTKHKGEYSSFQRKKAWEIGYKHLIQFALPIAGNYNYSGLLLTDDDIRLVAWFMTDGCFEGNSYFSICQSESKYHERIRALLQRLGLDFTEKYKQPRGSSYPNAKPFYVFYIPKGTGNRGKHLKGWEYLEKYLDKKVSPELHKMTRYQFKVFWEEMMYGDGSNFQQNKQGKLCCGTKEKADAYSQMAVTRGYAANIHSYQTKNEKTVYEVRIRDKTLINLNLNDPRGTKVNNLMPNDLRTVWCIENENGTIIARRNGKIVIIGNCPSIGAVVFARPTKSIPIWFQAIGRALRPAKGKDCCVIIDHTTNHAALPMPDVEIEWSLDPISLPKSSPFSLKCPTCNHVYKLISKEKRFNQRSVCPSCNTEFYFETRITKDGVTFDGCRKLTQIEIELGEASFNQPTEEALKMFTYWRKVQQENEYKDHWIYNRYRNAVIEGELTLNLFDLKKLASVLGYKNGWAWDKLQEISSLLNEQCL